MRRGKGKSLVPSPPSPSNSKRDQYEALLRYHSGNSVSVRRMGRLIGWAQLELNRAGVEAVTSATNNVKRGGGSRSPAALSLP
jgi:hypothetical protein